MVISVLGLAAFYVLVSAVAGSGCDKMCTDYSRFCTGFRDAGFLLTYSNIVASGQVAEFKEHKMPPSADCDTQFYKLICPQSCSICTSCDASVGEDVKSLETIAQSNENNLQTLVEELAAEKSATAELSRKTDKFEDFLSSTQPQVPDTDAQGFRLAFRHSSNQLTLSQFEGLYRHGALPGTFKDTSGKYQFRDPNLHFFWGETSSVRLDIFDLAGDKKSSIFFKIPEASTSNPTSWSKVFQDNCKYVQDSSQNKDYSTISDTCVYSNFLKGYAGSDGPSLALAKDDIKNCQNSKIFFMLQGGVNNKKCDWESNYRVPADVNNDYTIAYYSPVKDPVNAQIGLKMASKMEIRLSGAFSTSASGTNGYERVFRYPSFAGVDITNYYEGGVVDPNADISDMTAKTVQTHQMFRSDKLEEKITGAKKVMLVIYDIAGYVAEALTYQGTGDLKSWFGKDNLISNINWVFSGKYIKYSYEGDVSIGRRFYIEEAFGGCDNDPGYLLVACNPPSGQPPCPAYESIGGNAGEARHYICKILYTNSNGVQKSKFHVLGSAIEIFVQS